MSCRSLLLLLLSCFTGLCWAQQHAWNWECSPVTAQQDVDIDKVLGTWYLFKAIPSISTIKCVRMVLEKRNSSNDIAIYSTSVTLDGVTFKENASIAVVTPPQWYNRGTDVEGVVVDSPEDASTLTYAACETNDNVRYLGVYIFRKSSSVDMRPAYERLKAAGIIPTGEVVAEEAIVCPDESA